MCLNEIKHNNVKKEAENLKFFQPLPFLCMLYAAIAVNTTDRMNITAPNIQDHLADR